MQIGYKLAPEGFGPLDIVDQAVAAEQAGFDFVEISDHFHPWLDVQGHSPATWPLLGTLAAKTERVGLVTGVTCPHTRYHPAIIAQQAATVSLLSGGRFTLGVGAGERLNEHVVGTGFPAARERHERFRESLEIIRLLWQGGYQSYDGKHLRLEDARVFDLPETLPEIIVAISGKASATLAAELGDGIFGTEPRPELPALYRSAGGTGTTYCEIPLAWAPDEQSAVDAAHEKNAWFVSGWKIMSELPNPANFQPLNDLVTKDAVRRRFACGPDVARHLDVIQSYLDAGFDTIVLLNAGPDPDGFMEFFATELADKVRALTPSA